MYNISDEVLDLFKKNYRQIVKIEFNGKNETLTLTESDIRQGGLSIDRYSLSNSKIEIGSAISAELSLTLENNDERFSDVVFEGAELEVKIGIKKWDADSRENAQTFWIPCGFFTVDDPPRHLASISITALDRMTKFDVDINADGLFPTTPEKLVKECCSRCGVTLATDLSSLPNHDYEITYEYEDGDSLTYRDLLKFCAEIMGVCAFIDWNGELRLAWYADTDTVITASERYSSDLYENDITITGVQITDIDDNVYLKGTDDYVIEIEGNDLITHDYDTVAANLYNTLNGFAYRPYSATIKSMPHLYPLDKIVFTDKKGVEHSTIITNVTFKMNLSTDIAGKGETSTKSSYASSSTLTREADTKIKSLKKTVTDGNTTLTQTFEAENGKLLSLIETETTRATTAEDGLSTSIETCYSKIEQTSESITAEVSRAISSEETLNIAITDEETRATTQETLLIKSVEECNSKITQNADSITSEVNRATKQELVLQTNIDDEEERATAQETVLATKIEESNTKITQTADAITAEANRATTVENSLGTKIETCNSNITINANAISSEVTRAKNAEKELSSSIETCSSSIKQNADSITAEVTRAKNAEKELSSKISVNAENISAKVSSTGGSNSSFSWSLTTDGFYLYSKGTKVLNVTSSGLSVIGKGTFSGNLSAAGGTFSGEITTGGSNLGTTSSIINYSKLWLTGHNFYIGMYPQTSTQSLAALHIYPLISSGQKYVEIKNENLHRIRLTGNYELYSTMYNKDGDSILSSDKNVKHDIADLPDTYISIVDYLTPSVFKYNNGTSDRLHTGFIAQDLESALSELNIDTQDCAALVIEDLENKTGYGIRYSELIAILWGYCRKLKSEITELRSAYENSETNAS